MIVFDVLSHTALTGWKGEKMRLLLTEAGYGRALENQDKGYIQPERRADKICRIRFTKTQFADKIKTARNADSSHTVRVG